MWRDVGFQLREEERGRERELAELLCARMCLCVCVQCVCCACVCACVCVADVKQIGAARTFAALSVCKCAL